MSVRESLLRTTVLYLLTSVYILRRRDHSKQRQANGGIEGKEKPSECPTLSLGSRNIFEKYAKKKQVEKKQNQKQKNERTNNKSKCLR